MSKGKWKTQREFSIRALLYRWYQTLERKEHRLLYLFLEITRRCNLECLHCGSDCKASEEGSRLAPESWVALIEECRAAFDPSLSFVLTGGEPLLYPRLDAILSALSRSGRNWGLVTNGLLLDADRLRKLVDAGVRSVTVSLDGDEATHTRLRRRPEAWRGAVEALRRIGRTSIRYKDAVTCVFPEVLPALDRTAEILLDAGTTSWRLFRIFPSGRTKLHPDLLLDREQTWRMIEWIRDKRPELARRGLNLSLSCEGYIPFSVDRQVRDEPFFCRSGINMASVLCDGTVTGCSNNCSAFYAGNIAQKPLAELWESGFDRLRTRDFLKTSVCADCSQLAACRGGSLHLWDETLKAPAFCYIRELEAHRS